MTFNPLDNLANESSSELKKRILEAQRAESATKDTKKVETTPEPKEESAIPPKTTEPPKTEELILGKFKSQDDLVKAYQEAEKKITELGTKKTETTIQPMQPAVDPLWASLFGNNSQPAAKAKPDTSVEDDDEVTTLKKRLEVVEKAGYMSIMQQQAALNKIQAKEQLANDPDLPFDSSIEREIEDVVFKQYPQLKYQTGGYLTAHQLLKGAKAAEIAARKVEAAVKDALAKESAKKVAKVETPGKGDTETEIDPTKLSIADLRKYLHNDIGTLDR